MDTGPLKSFATWARTVLIREVTARIAVVLAPASPARLEQADTIAALDKAVSAAGGGESGRTAVADKVAYTWFNRVIALRFMDANGYTGIGVVSPERGRAGGQPEILAGAKRGNIDSAVVTSRTADAVTSLLNGTRRSDDPQGEAYALLLAEYCRYWNRSMPFMFEREGDYTELLIPSNLLADDSVMSRAITVLTEDVCQDVEVIGWLYQFYISERKEQVFAGFKQNRKAGAGEIPAATQLFTPHWIVRYLVENSLGRLWLLNRPNSRLACQMDYYIAPLDKETDFLKVARPEDLKIIDPACGSGHMLTYAFDLLYAIYEEEGYAAADIPGYILAYNLYGTEIDPRAGALAAFALTMKARARQRTFFNKQLQPNICVLEPISFTLTELNTLVSGGDGRAYEDAFWNQFQNADTFGSLIEPREDLIEPVKRHLEASLTDVEDDLLAQDLFNRARRVIAQAQYLSQRYNVVVANPPYMGNKSMNATLALFAKDTYPTSKLDLYAMFLERSINLCMLRGYVAMVAMQSWMYLSTYAPLRRTLLNTAPIAMLAHFGPHAFDTISGEIVQTAAFVLNRGRSPELRGIYLDITDGRSEADKNRKLTLLISHPESQGRYEASVGDIAQVPGEPIAYWLSSAARRLFSSHKALGDVLHITGGMTTGDNERFLRRWFEVSQDRVLHTARSAHEAASSGRRWFPYNKGGGARSWFGNRDYYVNWEDDGAEILSTGRATVRSRGRYFQESLTYSATGSGHLSIRYSEPGFLFDAKGPSCFSDGGNLTESLGFLASTTASYLLRALNPTVEFQTGDLARLPYIKTDSMGGVGRLIALVRDDEASQETCWEFSSSPLVLRGPGSLAAAEGSLYEESLARVDEFRRLAETNNSAFVGAAGLEGEVPSLVGVEDVTLAANPVYRFGTGKPTARYPNLARAASIQDLVSYAIGCMFGRYSLAKPGLILANQGDTIQDYLAQVPDSSLVPDRDNVIPIVDGDWFEDDIVARFRQFLRVTFSDQHFEENLRFVTDSLGVKDLRDYFVKSFYKDHVQRYKKRPIYWLFSSPKGSFNALIYMHRYTPSTVSTVLNEYLREFKAKLEASRQHHERLAVGAGTPRQTASAQKEVDQLRKVLLELNEYEHDVLYPLATQQVPIDLDDGVKTNYQKFGAALKKVPGLEASDE